MIWNAPVLWLAKSVPNQILRMSRAKKTIRIMSAPIPSDTISNRTHKVILDVLVPPAGAESGKSGK